MSKLVTFRFAVPTIVILAAVTIAIIALALATGTHGGGAWGYPN